MQLAATNQPAPVADPAPPADALPPAPPADAPPPADAVPPAPPADAPPPPPQQASTVGYTRQLWQAIQGQDVNGNDALDALAQPAPTGPGA
ncbi:hypothetical protein AWC00_22650 [Mycobacterium conspicuum]|nr:hypothetical protein AWC00_22650 [Mycobacterium conspicuum]